MIWLAGEALKATSTPGELTALVIDLAAMGVAGVLLVGVRGDLFVLVLLLSAAEILPLFLLAMRGLEQSLHVPLLFRTALYRMVALSCIALSLSLRFPEAFSPGLDDPAGGRCATGRTALERPRASALSSPPSPAPVWPFSFSSWAVPRDARLGGTEEADPSALVLAAVIDGPQRAVSLILCVVLFLGYPWEGGTGKLLWSAAVLGTVCWSPWRAPG